MSDANSCRPAGKEEVVSREAREEPLSGSDATLRESNGAGGLDRASVTQVKRVDPPLVQALCSETAKRRKTNDASERAGRRRKWLSNALERTKAHTQVVLIEARYFTTYSRVSLCTLLGYRRFTSYFRLH